MAHTTANFIQYLTVSGLVKTKDIISTDVDTVSDGASARLVEAINEEFFPFALFRNNVRQYGVGFENVTNNDCIGFLNSDIIDFTSIPRYAFFPPEQVLIFSFDTNYLALLNRVTVDNVDDFPDGSGGGSGGGSSTDITTLAKLNQQYSIHYAQVPLEGNSNLQGFKITGGGSPPEPIYITDLVYDSVTENLEDGGTVELPQSGISFLSEYGKYIYYNYRGLYFKIPITYKNEDDETLPIDLGINVVFDLERNHFYLYKDDVTTFMFEYKGMVEKVHLFAIICPMNYDTVNKYIQVTTSDIPFLAL